MEQQTAIPQDVQALKVRLYLINGFAVRASSWTDAHNKFALYLQGQGELQ